jgi:hypothetical protein
MSCWKITGLGLLLGGMAAACTITSDDDDTGTGGSGASTGGTSTSSGGSGAAAGTSSTGGTAGSTSGGGAGGAGAADGRDSSESRICNTCLAENCPTDHEACAVGTACRTEFNVLRNCAIKATGYQVPSDKVDTCISEIYGGPSFLTPETTAILSCSLTLATSCDPCFEAEDAGA